jgi:estrone sulfotransferase
MPEIHESKDKYIEVETAVGEKSSNAIVYQDLFKKFGNWNICFLPKHYSSHSDYIQNFQVRNDDIWVVSFIKAGTTWTQEMAWMIGNDLDYNGAKVILPVRFPYFE